MEGLEMKRTKEVVSEEEYEFGLLRSGRRYKMMNNGVEKGESNNEPMGREPCAIV
jgi:hypothetical protein